MSNYRPTTLWWTWDGSRWTDGSSRPLATVSAQATTARAVPAVLSEEAWKEYDAQGHGAQSHKRLCERGGFSWAEMAVLLFERIKRLEAAA